MINQAPDNPADHLGPSFRAVVAGALFVLLTACGGGGGDGSVGIAGGQDPDPVILDFPIAFVKRPVPVDEDGLLIQDDARELLTFEVGAHLFVRDRASPSTDDQNITFDLMGDLADVRDAEFSYDGERVLFAMRGPFDENLDDEDQPTWNIWEYDIPTKTLRRIITSDITSEEGHDIAPHYLPDGRIIFTSTRQRQSKAILLDEGKPQFEALDEDENEPAFVLHVMDADGSDIGQVSFNQSHDMDPSVLDNGQVVFSRWDHAGGNNAIHVYKMNPDGTELELLYGANSHATGTDDSTIQFLAPREQPDGQIVSIVKPFTDTDGGGDIVTIDVLNYVENTQPTVENIGVLTGPAQAPATVNDVRTDTLPSPGGRFRTAFPLWDGTDRIMVSWSLCRLLDDLGTPEPEDDVIRACTADRLADPAAVTAPPIFGIWIYDRVQETQLPVVVPEEDFVFTDIAAALPRNLPPVILDLEPGVNADADLVSEAVGVLHIRSVYDIDGVDSSGDITVLADPAQTTAAERPARFLRVVKTVSIPDEEIVDIPGTAFGPDRSQGMKEVVAYAPIEPDGSVKVKVPANVALAVSVLDENGRRITPRHQNWLQVRPGEVRECNGCHDPASGLSHGRAQAFDSINVGALTTGSPFPNTDPALFADFGETMAEVRTRIDASALNPSVNVVFDDVWTDEVAAGRAADASFVYTYADMLTPAPTIAACVGAWSSACRIVINYEEHVHPLWGLSRQILDVDGVTVLEDNTCTLCHTPVDDMGNPRVPDGQLDLTDGLDPIVTDHFKSYRELVFNDNEQDVIGGVLQDIMVVIGQDPVTGDDILAPVTVQASMSAAGANSSGTFFSRFDTGGTHEGRLSAAELRMLSEWLDVGAQYYNNPFDVPQN